MLFKEIITLYFENHMKLINTLCEQYAELLITKAGGTNSHHWAKKGKHLNAGAIGTSLILCAA
jgi:hypothetical protein